MATYRLVRAVLAPVLRVVWGVRALGGQVPPGPLIVVSNHDSLSDPFFLGAASERPLRFLAKEELWRSRVAGRLLDALGGIPVRRGAGDVDAMSAARAALAAGHAVVILPQGTVLGTTDRPWHRGAARLALHTGAPVLPVRIVGADRVLRPGSWLPRLARVRVVAGAPIAVEPARPTIAAARDLTERIRLAIDALA